MKIKLILGSSSPRRKEILSKIYTDISIIKPDIDEQEKLGENYTAYLKRICLEKLNKTKTLYFHSDEYSREYSSGHSLKHSSKKYSHVVIVCADTIVYQNEILQKPTSPKHALEMLRKLNGKSHTVISGVCFLVLSLPADKEKDIKSKNFYFQEKTKVYFNDLEDSFYVDYIQKSPVLDKAGAYGIQDDLASVFVKKIHGNFDNVMGFPLAKFYFKLLSKLNGYATSSKLYQGW